MEERFDFLKEFDFFGKLPEFYIKRKSKQVTIFGRVLTILFILMYIIIIIYKMYRVFKRIDITFYDSYLNTEETPIVHLTKENFSLIFAVYNDSSLPFIDESIYYPMAYFYGEEIKEIEIQRCDLDKIGSKYKKFFSNSELNNYYCLNNIDFELKPYENSISLLLFKCKNTSENNNHCKPKEFIEEFLHNKLLRVYGEDILITPINYDNPVKEYLNFLDCGIFVNNGEYYYSQIGLVRIETSTNIIGFDFLSNPKIDEYIKFDNVLVKPIPNFNLNEKDNENSVCITEFQLNDKILLEKRKYIQLIDVLGEVGGFMELINSFFRLICSFFSNILYKKEIINSLFLFDIKNKIISIKKKDISIYKMKEKENNKEKNTKKQNKLMRTIRKLKIVRNVNDKKIENDLNKKNANIYKRVNDMENNEIDSLKNNTKDKNKDKSKILFNLNINHKPESFLENEDERIIENINFKDILFSICDCNIRKRRNINNILINKCTNITIEKLDIFNIFRNLCLIENINKNLKYDLGTVQMSEEFSNNY